MMRKTIIILSLLGISLTGFNQNITPEVDGSLYSFSFANLYFEINAGYGSKVSSLKLDGHELLVLEDPEQSYLWGATLWPAPQNEFGWPPPMELDNGVYTTEIQGNRIYSVSPEDVDGQDNNMQFIKEFMASDADTSVSLNYSLINKESSNITKALWELTRVPVDGISFWPTGPEGVWGDLADGTVESNLHTWIDIDGESRRSLKFFADGSLGWFAHIDPEKRLLIKTFEDVNHADFADGEGEIELWIAGNYIELENQSAASTLQPGDTLHYDVKWYLRQVPDEVSVTVGSADLLSFVYQTIGQEMPPLGPDGITSPAISMELEVFPNPAGEYIAVTLPEHWNKAALLEIYDLTGQQRATMQVEGGELVDISRLQTGLYIYMISDLQNTYTGKLRVE